MHISFIICVTLLHKKQKGVLIFQYDIDFRLYLVVVNVPDETQYC